MGWGQDRSRFNEVADEREVLELAADSDEPWATVPYPSPSAKRYIFVILDERDDAVLSGRGTDALCWQLFVNTVLARTGEDVHSHCMEHRVESWCTMTHHHRLGFRMVQVML